VSSPRDSSFKEDSRYDVFTDGWGKRVRILKIGRKPIRRPEKYNKKPPELPPKAKKVKLIEVPEVKQSEILETDEDVPIACCPTCKKRFGLVIRVKNPKKDSRGFISYPCAKHRAKVGGEAR
jgi:hypothetical protein